ncbi:IPT/TIG domain-containing protein [Cohnella thermotolerans]|uniref:IPT/TIG domain-containing protein n=1 Tax=Cohnella thermotolerans TaxID=329858 RepID=UPI000686A303
MMFFLAFIIAASGLFSPGRNASAATSDYVSVTKSVNPTKITTEQEATVSLSIKGTPPVNVIVPNDVILVIDKSGSMAPAYNNGEDKMTNAKEAAKGFIDLMDMTKHRVGIVDFSSINQIGSFDLTTDKTAAKNYIDTIQANGSTSTGDAIQKAMDLLANHRPEAQPVIILLTDGDATYPTNDPYGYAKSKAMEAKDAGIIFYTIALLKQTDDPNTSGPNILLKEMATTADHHHFVLGSTGLSDIYAAIVKEIGLASAFDVQVNDIVSPDFEIVPGSYDDNIPKPTVTGNTLTWTFNELKDKTLTFTYKIRPKDKNKTGALPVSTVDSSISYKDYAGANRTKAIPSVNLSVVFPAPVITSIVEPSGHPNGGNTVTITGQYFRPNATVEFINVPATNIQVVSDTQITATVPKGSQGMATVTVRNPDGQFATGQYQYMTDPIVTSITPNNGDLAGGNVVELWGQYFMKGMTVTIGNQPATVKTNNGATYATVIVPTGAQAGPVDVVLTNPDGTSTTVTGGYTYNKPPEKVLTITSVSPAEGPMQGGTAVYISGDKIDSNVQVTFGNTSVPVTTYYNETRILVMSPPSSQSGPVSLRLTNPDGETVTKQDAFIYSAPPVLPDPTITKLSLTSGLIAGGDQIYIDGTGFQAGLKLYFGTAEAQVLKVYSASRMLVVSPAVASPGVVDVRVVNPDGKEGTKTGAFTYTTPPPPPAPTVTSLSPNNGPTSGGTQVYINGTGFMRGLKVYFGTQEAVVNTYYSSSRLLVIAPANNQAGTVDVRIVNPDAQEGLLVGGYTYNALTPVITGLSPDHGPMSGGTQVYVSGANFDPDMTVTFNGQNVPIMTYYGTTRILITTPSSSTSGAVPFVITLPNGNAATGTYTYDAPPPVLAPVITKMSATSGNAAGGDFIYIDGANFVNGLKIYFGDVEGRLYKFYSNKRILIQTPAGTKGSTVTIKIVNPNGQESNTMSFTYQ